MLFRELAFEIMKKNLYNRVDDKSFFNVLGKHIFTDTNQIVKLILPACYFGHLNILKWLLNNGHDINSKNNKEETGLHLGKTLCYSFTVMELETIFT